LQSKVCNLVIKQRELPTWFYYGGGPAIGFEGAIPVICHLPTFFIFALYFAKRGRIMPVILAHLYLDVIAQAHHALS
jgi:hypothetical protein